jgi:hypothetical protein
MMTVSVVMMFEDASIRLAVDGDCHGNVRPLSGEL